MSHTRTRLGSLFLTMLKIGLFTFGGGYAMLALLEDEFVQRKGWMDREEFLHMAAIAESTPGPIAINAATYIGYKNAGITGALLATVGICIPSFAIIYLISLFFDAFRSLTYVAYAFNGIRVCVVYLILSAGLRMWKGLKRNALHTVLLISVAGCMIACSLLAVKLSTVVYVLAGGMVGVAVHLVSRLRDERRTK
ncbi:MAG: chromate transporter [Clostridia bacterium]|nr:chromate transporter [Clostridia bacterium]